MGYSTQAFLSFTVSQSLFTIKFVHWVGDAIQPSHPLLPLLLLPSIFPSIRVFSNELALHINWPKIVASASVLSMNIQDWFPLGLTGLISLLAKRLSRVFSSTTAQNHQFLGAQPSLWPNSHICTWLPQKKKTTTHSFDYMDLNWQVMSLLFNTLSRFVIAFLPRSRKWKSLSCAWFFATPQTVQSMNSPGQNTGVGGSLSFLQGIFPTQGSNPGLSHCRRILCQLSHKGSPRILEWVAYPFSRGSSRPRNPTWVSCIAGGLFTSWDISAF